MREGQEIHNRGGSGNIIIQIHGDDNHVNVDGQPYLVLTDFTSRRGLPQNELDLLDPFRRSIPLTGRDQDMTELWNWLHSPRPIAVRTIIGRAGAGKTRMAVELIARLEQDKPGQWHAGFAEGRELLRFAGQQNLSAWGWQRPTLIIVDYAAALVEPVNAWLHDLAENTRASGKPLRLLLLEREASTDQGWLRSLHDDSWSGAGVQELFDPFEPLRLKVLEDQPRRAVLSAMLQKAGDFLHRKSPALPSPGQDHVFEHHLAQPIWEDPLYLMMAALVAIDARLPLTEILSLSRTDLALRMADRELQRVARFASDANEQTLLKHLAACATLTAGLAPDEAAVVMEEECQSLKRVASGGAGSLTEKLASALPRSGGGVAPVVPDIIGEALVLRVLGGPAAATSGKSTVLRLARRQARPVIACIIRTAQDFSAAGNQEPLQWLAELVKIGQAASLDLLMQIENSLVKHAQQTLALREQAAEVGLALAEQLSHLANITRNEDILATLGIVLNNLANRLNDLGRLEEALNKAQEAERILRQLSQKRSDVLPHLAMALSNMANRLGNLGRLEEALTKVGEAESIYRQLSRAQPSYFSQLAASLINLANTLGGLGRPDEALPKAKEAESILRKFAESKPEVFLPDLALSLNAVAQSLINVGRHEEGLQKAQEAERIRRQLAQAQPDAFLPDLALSVTNLANLLSELGKREEAFEKALEAESIYRHLAQSQPEAFLPFLAGSLNNLANSLSELGKWEEALEKTRETESIYRELARARPDVFLPDLAMSLNNSANSLCELGRREQALEKAREAESIYRRLAQTKPQVFLPGLAMSLCNLANRLGDLGRREEALAKAEEAERIRRRLADARPLTSLPDLAMSLNTLAHWLSELGRTEEALAKAREAETIYRQLADALPDAFLPHLAGSLINVANCLSGTARHEEAMAKVQEAEAIYRKLARDRPDAFSAKLAATLTNLATMLGGLGRHEESLAKAQEAKSIYQKLSHAYPDVFSPEWARSLLVAGLCLWSMERHEEAAASFLRAAKALERLFRRSPHIFSALMDPIIQNYVRCVEQAGLQPDIQAIGPILAVLQSMQNQGQ